MIAAMADTTPTRDLTRATFAVLCLGGLLWGCFAVLRPFLVPLSWAALLVIASWPLLEWLQRWFGGRRWPAVTTIAVLLVAVFLVPLGLLLSVLVERAPGIAARLRALVQEGLPPPPEWIGNVPLVGHRVAATWADLAAAGPQGIAARVAPYADDVANWLVAQVGSAGMLMLHLLLTLLFAVLLFARGEAFGIQVRRFAHRLAGDRGDEVVLLAAKSVRAVAFGVVVTALAQTAAGGLGLAIAGVPAFELWTAVIFVASIAQIGGALVLAGVAAWLFATGATGWGIAMVVWTIVVGSIDNFLRPVLIRKGVDLPLALVFSGVVGGLIAFGPVGLFAGPVVLAVAYTLLLAWIAEDKAKVGEREPETAL